MPDSTPPFAAADPPPAALPLDEAAACPMCGYSLRAIARPQCPECGHELQITLRHPNPLWGRRGLLALIFAWLLIAGTLNGVRAGMDVHASMQPVPAQTWTVNLGGLGGLGGPGGTTAPGLAGRLNGLTGETVVTFDTADVRTVRPVFPGAPTPPARTAAPRPVPIVTTTPSGTFSITTAPGPANAGLFTAVPAGGGWSAVPWDQWARLGSWSIVAVVALFCVVMLVRHRRRSASRRLVTVLTAIAWIGFGGYVAYNALTLAADLV